MLMDVLFLVNDIHVDIDLKSNDTRLTLDVQRRAESGRQQPQTESLILIYCIPRSHGLERTLPSSACRKVLRFR